jgi:hypothetical protein
MKPATFILTNVKSCNVLFRVLLVCIRYYLKLVLKHEFAILMPVIRTLYISVSKNVRIRGYFTKPKGMCEQTSLKNTNSQYSKLFI